MLPNTATWKPTVSSAPIMLSVISMNEKTQPKQQLTPSPPPKQNSAWRLTAVSYRKDRLHVCMLDVCLEFSGSCAEICLFRVSVIYSWKTRCVVGGDGKGFKKSNIVKRQWVCSPWERRWGERWRLHEPWRPLWFLFPYVTNNVQAVITCRCTLVTSASFRLILRGCYVTIIAETLINKIWYL